MTCIQIAYPKKTTLMNDDDGNGLYGGSVVTLTLEALDLIMIWLSLSNCHCHPITLIAV